MNLFRRKTMPKKNFFPAQHCPQGDQVLNAYRNSRDTTGVPVSLSAIIRRILDGDRQLAEKTQNCRILVNTDKDAYRDYKAKNLPAVTFAGTFPKGKRKAQHLQQHSGLLTVDIDDLNPNDIGYLLAELAQMPQVVVAFVSPGGKGTKVIVPIDPIPQDALEHKGAFEACVDFFDDLATEYNFEVDTSGSDCSRLCFLAHDSRAITRDNPIPITWDRDEYLESLQNADPVTDNSEFDGDVDIAALEFIAPDDYQTWIETGFACYNSGVPFDIWDDWSKKSPKYKVGETAAKWATFGNDYTGRKITWGTVVHRAKENGYIPKRTYTVSKRLEINPTEQEAYKNTLCRVEANTASLQNAITEFLQHIESRDTPHYHILKYDTGIGKSYGALANAKKLGKKVFSLLCNHDLAAEQTDTAKTLGFNDYRFRGRSYNFENSNLRSIPLKMREQNETLFHSYQVMCPVYDKLEPYQNKRLNPYMMCFSCPLLEACKSEGYWSQFRELRNVDYLSACIQDIIFNPDFWTLLDTFLTGSVPFEIPETDEEAAISAMLGLQDNETQDIFQPFDFAMIDDYTTSGLYSEAHYTLEEITKLKNAWAGTHTGDVLKQIHEAIVLLYHDSTQRAVDILTELFDSLDDDTRETVNTHLTQHADRDEHGQIFPTAPWAAIRNGIASLDTLTPVWHSKDWTLLHQLETIINHCQNTSQAPMFIDDSGNITLSIPPQVHLKLKAVLLMSATADFEATKNAFRGQVVTFTTSEGKPAHWANGVKAFQYVNARWTTQSIFEHQKDENGKTVYDDDGKPIIEGLTPKAVEMLQKLTELARADSRKCVFISYKEFTQAPITELEVVKALHEAFDTITHYDIATGMNFEDHEIFIAFGYPKVDPEVVNHEGRVQLRHENAPLDFNYTTTAEQGEVYTSTHGRYTDPRVERVRQQLATQKLQQATGRARPSRWKNTCTIAFTAEPIPGFTELATPFVDEDWQNTESFDLTAVIEARRLKEQRVAELTAENTIAEWQEALGCSYERARQLWHEAGGKEHKDDVGASLLQRILEMKAQKIGERKIAAELGISYGKVRSLVKKSQVH